MDILMDPIYLPEPDKRDGSKVRERKSAPPDFDLTWEHSWV